jgi:hypothetical protein
LPCHGFKQLCATAEGLRHPIPHLLLIPRETLHRRFEIAGHEGLQTVAVHTDQLAQKADGKQILPFVLFLEDDLRQDGARDVVARPRILHFEIGAFLHHFA